MLPSSRARVLASVAAMRARALMRAVAPFSNRSGWGRLAGVSKPSQRATARSFSVWRAQRSLEGLLRADQVFSLVISNGVWAARASRTGFVLGLLLKEEAALLIDELFDEVGGGLVAVVGENGEGGGDFEWGGLEVAAREFVAFGEGAVDAEAFGEPGDLTGGHLAGGLDGLAGDREAAAFGGEGVEEGLKDGAELAAGVEGAVELVGLGIAGGDDGADGSGGGLDGDEGALQVWEGGDEFVDAVAGELLQFAVDAGGGGESAGEEVVLVEELVEVTAGAADGVGLHLARGQEVERGGEGLVALLEGDFPLGGHLAENLVALAEGGLLIVAGGKVVGSADDADEEGALGDGELGGLFSKVGLSGLFDAVGSGAEVDAVEVGGNDLVLGIVGFDAEGEGGLEELAVEGEVANLVGIARELHRDSGGTLGDAAVFQVAEGSAEDTSEIDAAVFEKASIFSGGEGVDEVLRDFFARNDAAAGAMDGGQFLAVPVKEEGALLHSGDLFDVIAGGGDPISDAHEKEQDEANEGQAEKNPSHRAYPSGDLVPDFWFVVFLPGHALRVLLRGLYHFPS